MPQGQVGGEPITADHLSTLARSAGRVDLAFCLTDVLVKGWERNEFWSSATGYGYGEGSAYVLAFRKGTDSFLEMLRSKEMLLFVHEDTVQDKSTRLAAMDSSRLGSLCDQTEHPSAMFHEAFWPAVYKELLAWNCYSRPGVKYGPVGLVAYSRSASAKEMFERLLKRMPAPDADNSQGFGRAAGLVFAHGVLGRMQIGSFVDPCPILARPLL